MFTPIHLDEVFIPIICVRFIAPLMVGVSEAWSNAVMLGLFNKLQRERVGDGVNDYKQDSKKKKQ